MHPDQLYTVRQLQHQDLQAEAKIERMRRECAHARAAAWQAWFVAGLQRLNPRRAARIPAANISN